MHSYSGRDISGAVTTVDDDAPDSPIDGTLWYRKSNKRTYGYDANNSTWQEVCTDIPHPQPKLSNEDLPDIAALDFDAYPSGVVHFKKVIDVDTDLIHPYVREEAQPSNCGLQWMEDGDDKWAEDYQGNRHDISLLLEQPARLGGLGENEPVMEHTPKEIVEFFNNCEQAFYKCLIRYIDLYPMMLNTIWWRMRGHVLHYKPGGLLGLHNDNDTNYRVIDGLRYHTARNIAIYQVLNGMIDFSSSYTGGEFVFPHADCVIKTETGDAVFFPANYLGAHGVKKVESGERFSYLTQFGQGKEDEFEITEAPDSYGWLPPAYMPWVFQDYEKFFNSAYSKSGNDWRNNRGSEDGSLAAIQTANPVSQQRSIEGDPKGAYQPYDE